MSGTRAKLGGRRAVMFIQDERQLHLEPARQQQVLLDLITERRFTMVAITSDEDAAVTLVEGGRADVVVVCVVPADIEPLEARIIGAGGWIEGARRQPRAKERSELGAMIRRAASTGLTVEAVARIFDLHPDAVQLALRDPGTGRTVPVARTGGTLVPQQGAGQRRTGPVPR